jgi:hypothetical protein
MRKFSTIFPGDLRLTFAFRLSVLPGNSINSQALVFAFPNYHNSRGGFSAGGFSATVSYPAILQTRTDRVGGGIAQASLPHPTDAFCPDSTSRNHAVRLRYKRASLAAPAFAFLGPSSIVVH